MGTLWFCLIAAMIAMYVVLDGFDLGVGILHLLVAKTDAERRTVLRSIGPVWDGNEVWLLAAGGTLYFAFPALYAASFSGFYLPLMIVLWLLILRAISIEFRSHIEGPVWAPLWDAVFCGASLLLAVFFGAVLGNVVRGVPLDANGDFFLPLWTSFRVDGEPGIFDWYTMLVGAAALLTLALHGALWLAVKTEGAVQQRARRLAGMTWWAVATLTAIVTGVTVRVQPHVTAALSEHPWGFVFPAIVLGGLAGMRLSRSRKSDRTGFLASCGYIVGMLTSAVFGLYPLVLPATDPARALTVENAKAADYGLKVGLVWWVIGMALAAGYFVFLYRHFAGKVTLDGEHGGY